MKVIYNIYEITDGEKQCVGSLSIVGSVELIFNVKTSLENEYELEEAITFD